MQKSFKLKTLVRGFLNMALLVSSSSMAFAQNAATDGGNDVSTASSSQFNKSGLQAGKTYYVNATSLNVRSMPSSSGKLLAILTAGDAVEIVSTLGGDTPFVEVKLITGVGIVESDKKMYVSSQFLKETKPSELSGQKPSKYFVVQNVATEMVRVYERCTPAQVGDECDHRLILESDMVVGRRKKEDGDAKRWFTWLGHYKITGWRKFHQDGGGHYPSWYDPSYPSVPEPNSSFKKWFSKEVMPDPEQNVMRGAFGWFAAFVGPGSNDQWIHGTAGWGADGGKFVDVTRNFFVNMVKDARSSGCTRVENGLVAYLRDILPVGTEIMRVYAWEGLKDSSLSAYQAQREENKFDYILTKESVRQSGSTIRRDAVLARNVPQSEWIEEGTYSIDQYPDVRKYKVSPLWIGAGTGALGNVYRIPKKQFRGVYLIDSGRFVNYEHPASLAVGGYPNVVVPNYMVSTNQNFTLKFDTSTPAN